MALTSSLLSQDPRIQEAHRNRNRPIAFGEPQSISVARIQFALVQIGYSMPNSFARGGPDGVFGDETLRTVRKFQSDKHLRPDGMVGPDTLDALDAELNKRVVPPLPGPLPVPPAPDHDTVINSAFRRSRVAVQMVLFRLRSLQTSINAIDNLDGPAKIVAISTLNRAFTRDIAVVAYRLMVSSDPLSADFRDALGKAIDLINKNRNASSGIKEEPGDTGRCDPKQFDPPGVPFAATTASDPDPRVSVCSPFFNPGPNANTAENLQRDVITHEFFHLVGLADVKNVSNTSDALRNANTLAQIVAWLTDRSRQRDSGGGQAAMPPLPSP
jgi:hypothetical protein